MFFLFNFLQKHSIKAFSNWAKTDDCWRVEITCS